MSAPLSATNGNAPSYGTNAPSVPLSRRRDPNENPPSEPLWALNSQQEEAPLSAKCDRHSMPRDVCCKTLRSDDERTLIDPDVVRDIIIGLSDGLTVPFALTAGLSSIGSSRIVVLGGVAELIAGAISMGIGGFLASQAERDHFRYQRKETRSRVQRSCAGEMEREVHAVLGPVGVEEKISRQIADSLLILEDQQVDADENNAKKMDSSRGSSWFGSWRGKDKIRLEEDAQEANGLVRPGDDVGLTAFLLKFGEGLEEVPDARMFISAFTIGMGYLIGGIVPLLPYFFISEVRQALIYSCIVTGAVLLVFGGVKQHVTGAKGGFGGYLWGAVSTLCVGGAAAGAAFAIVAALEGAE